MIYVTVHLYAGTDGLEALRNYETQAIRISKQYGAKLISAFVPMEVDENTPDEIHILTFPSMSALEQYRKDPNRLQLQNMHPNSIANAKIYVSEKIIDY